VYQPYISNR